MASVAENKNGHLFLVSKALLLENRDECFKDFLVRCSLYTQLQLYSLGGKSLIKFISSSISYSSSDLSNPNQEMGLQIVIWIWIHYDPNRIWPISILNAFLYQIVLHCEI
eukprot:TRINITY_DN38493_c0_g1_i1.p1 TRINITY_DN38493_c0_g1~~TRINITY_DN38493_c0_g1_i1.p1  ORF type:complete len:110 (+),score=4.16 TRINITY_DN38493_c0_g1_i1:128-457(+)